MFRKILILSVVVFLMAGSVFGNDTYKKYKISTNEEYLLKLSFSNGQTILTLYSSIDENNNETLVFDQNDVEFIADTVFVKSTKIFCSQGFFTPDGLVSTNEIGKVKMDTNRTGKVVIYFVKKSKSASKFVRSRSKNKFGLNKNITIESDEFIRGSAVSFWSDINIDGEVNKDVIAIFGNINISDKAIIRGDVLAINGEVNHSKTSTIYGTIQASNVKDKKRGFKFWRLRRHKTNLEPTFKFYYNRIDGATPQIGLSYKNDESMLPELDISVGHGFASERFRYHVGLKQYVIKSKKIFLSGEVYKKLISDDDRIISETENTLFALFATEDYKDYLEAEGGILNAGVEFPWNIGLDLNYRIEKYKSLPSHSGLWSMFGGSKEFRPNFSSLGSIRTASLGAMNGEEMSVLGIQLKYNNNGKENYPYNSFNTANLSFEWTPKTANDEFDYNRFLLTATRYQTLDRTNSLIIKAEYGKVDGNNVPTHKAFYVGGLGTLYGYNHKEYAGTEYWLSSIDYKIKFPSASWDTWLFYEIGQLATNLQNLSDSEVKNSIGIGLTFTDIIRVNVAKRLDRSSDTVTLTIRLKHQF